MTLEQRVELLEDIVRGLTGALSRQANTLQKCSLCFELREMEELKNETDPETDPA